MKKLVGERDLEAAGGGVFVVSPEMILTPSARDYASRHNIRLQWPSADAGRGDETAMDRAIRDAVTAELGRADDHVISAVRASLGEATPPGPARLPVMETPASRALPFVRAPMWKSMCGSVSFLACATLPLVGRFCCGAPGVNYHDGLVFEACFGLPGSIEH